MISVENGVAVGAPQIPILYTERLKLRGWTSTDVEDLERVYKNPDVVEFLTANCKSPSVDEVWYWWNRQGYGPWAVTDRKTGRFLGTVSLALPGHWPTPEVSWVLDRRFWGRGLASEAAKAVIDYAFDVFKFEELMSVCLIDNQRSVRVMQKLGMVPAPLTLDESGDLLKMYVITRLQWQLQTSKGSAPLR